ncbi:MAG: tetratricopeptide repeat protein [Treponema sp.]|jgi:tetratricopeptide (TPR) repeat protein|nr:tetratricopeptide repeat protein [Treponema sp.]
MDFIIPILLAVIGIVTVAVVIIVLTNRMRSGLQGGKSTVGEYGSKDKVFKDAQRKLNKNPHDINALAIVGEKYFVDNAWDEAYRTYEILSELISQNSNHKLNEFEIYQHYGISAMHMDHPEEAYKIFSAAYNIHADDFEVNHNLGVIEFQQQHYDQAINFLQAARAKIPDHAATLRYLGQALFRVSRYKEAMLFIRRAIELAPNDRESLLVLGECYYEAGQNDQALKIFSHLRPDPTLGPNACLLSGTINISKNQIDAAAQDFEIGLKHSNIKPEILIELRYRLAVVLFQKGDIDKALPLLRQVQAANPTYKDVPALISKYQELNSNKNLQIFMTASSADFIALCRRIILNYFPRSEVKITDISYKNEWADILADINTPKWQDIVMFRFIRSPGIIGEMVVRDFHVHIKDVKAGKGICLSVGKYSEEARHFTEARLIDLIEKEKLVAILKAIDVKVKK